MIDNTWATPLFLRPLDFGVDLSIHALTKYPGGHSDIMLGSVSATAATYTRLREAQMQIGINAAPDDAYLTIRGLKTMEVACAPTSGRRFVWRNGWRDIAASLGSFIPPFPPSRSRPLEAAVQRRERLVLLRSRWRGNREADAFLDALRIFGLGYSWGGFESLALQVDLSDRLFAKAPSEGPVIRLQVGLEDVDDLQEDLEAGFAAISALG